MHFCNETLQHVEIRKAPESKDAGDSVRSHLSFSHGNILNHQILEPKSFKPNWPSQLTRTRRAFHPTVVVFLQLVLVLVDWAKLWIWIKICNLKDGGHGDKDRGIWERRGDIIIIRASSFAHKPKLCPHQQPPPKEKNSLWSVVTPITPAKPSLSGEAADLRTPHQQIGLGEGLGPDKRGPLPLLLYLKSITLAFTFSAPPPPPTTTTHLPPSPAFLPPSSDTGLEPAPQQSPMLNPQPPPPLMGWVPLWTHRLWQWGCCWRTTTWCRLKVYLLLRHVNKSV